MCLYKNHWYIIFFIFRRILRVETIFCKLNNLLFPLYFVLLYAAHTLWTRLPSVINIIYKKSIFVCLCDRILCAVIPLIWLLWNFAQFHRLTLGRLYRTLRLCPTWLQSLGILLLFSLPTLLNSPFNCCHIF